MQYLAQYFDKKYDTNISVLLIESTVDKALKEAEKLLNANINTSKNYEQIEIYKQLVKLTTASNIIITEDDKAFINKIIEDSNEQYKLENGEEKYIDPLENQVQHKLRGW